MEPLGGTSPPQPPQAREVVTRLMYGDIAESTAWLQGLLNETPADRPGLHVGPPTDRAEITFRRPERIRSMSITGDLTGFSVTGKYGSGGMVILSSDVDEPNLLRVDVPEGGQTLIGLCLTSSGQSLIKKIEIFVVRPWTPDYGMSPEVQAASDGLDQRMNRALEALEEGHRAGIAAGPSAVDQLTAAAIRGRERQEAERTRLERPMLSVRSSATTHFTQSLHYGEREDENLAGLAGNRVRIRRVLVQTTLPLELELMFWRMNTFDAVNIDEDSFLGRLSLQSTPRRADRGRFYYEASGLDMPYEDLNGDSALHVSLVIVGPTNKPAGEQGAVAMEVFYEEEPSEEEPALEYHVPRGPAQPITARIKPRAPCEFYPRGCRELVCDGTMRNPNSCSLVNVFREDGNITLIMTRGANPTHEDFARAVRDHLSRRNSLEANAPLIPGGGPCEFYQNGCPDRNCAVHATAISCPRWADLRAASAVAEGLANNDRGAVRRAQLAHLCARCHYRVPDGSCSVGGGRSDGRVVCREFHEHASSTPVQSVALTPEQVRAQARSQRLPRSRRRAAPDEDGEHPVVANPPVYRGHRVRHTRRRNPRRRRRQPARDEHGRFRSISVAEVEARTREMASQVFSPREQDAIRARVAAARDALVVDPVTQDVFRPEPHIIEVPITNRNPEHGVLTTCGEYTVLNGIDFAFEPDKRPLFRIKPLSAPEENWKRRFRIRIDVWDAMGAQLLARIYDATLEDYENPQVPEDDHYRILGRARAGDRLWVVILNQTQGMTEWDMRVRLQATRLIRQVKGGRKWRG